MLNKAPHGWGEKRPVRSFSPTLFLTYLFSLFIGFLVPSNLSFTYTFDTSVRLNHIDLTSGVSDTCSLG